MIIREANIGKFGKLENQKYQFAPQINVIYGANESGKSTLMQFLKAMLFGLEKTRVRKTLDTYNRYEPWDTPAYFYGSMMFETGQQQFLLERNFYYKEKRARLVISGTVRNFLWNTEIWTCCLVMSVQQPMKIPAVSGRNSCFRGGNLVYF